MLISEIIDFIIVIMLVWAKEWRGSDKRDPYELVIRYPLIKARGDCMCIFI